MRAAFPGMAVERAEDAVAEAELQALLAADLLATYPVRGCVAWMKVVAERDIRSQWRRRAFRGEVGGDALELAHRAGPDRTDAGVDEAEARARVGAAIVVAAGVVPARWRAAVEAALWLLVDDPGLSVTEAAEACEVRREYVNNARMALRAALAA